MTTYIVIYVLGTVSCILALTLISSIAAKLETKKIKREATLRDLVKKDIKNALGDLYWHNIGGFDNHVNQLIDKRLAEKDKEADSDA